MIIKVNSTAITIDVSASAELTELFGTTNGTFPIGFIAKLRIKEINGVEYVQIVDKNLDEHSIPFQYVTSINGNSGFQSNLEVFNVLNLALFNL